MTQKEACEYLGISTNTFKQEIKKGRIGYLKIGKSKRFTQQELEKCLNNLTYSDFTNAVKSTTHTSHLSKMGKEYSFAKLLTQQTKQKQKSIVKTVSKNFKKYKKIKII